MSAKRLSVTVAILVAGLLFSRPVQAQQSVSLNIGTFFVRGEDARIQDDVLLENLNLFAFRLEDFNGVTVGGDWLIGFGEYFEAGVGLGYYQQTVTSVYNDFVDVDGSEIFQDSRLRVVPMTVTLRVLPFGRGGAVEPYFGGGFGVFNWRYSEFGEFIDFSTFDIFRDRFVADGNELGGVILGGVRIPFGSQFAIGGEVRYQDASGRVGTDQGFLADRIDLGGFATQVTFRIGF